MSRITLEEAQRRLPEVIASGVPGEEIEIVQDQQVIAKLVPLPPRKFPSRAGSAKGSILYMADDFDAPLDDFKVKPRPRFGSAQGSILYMADDFDAPLEEFKEYME